jgi:hypothetical protein
MDPAKQSLLLTDDRDMRILQHVARHRLTTNDVIHRLFCPTARANAAVKISTRLVRMGLLRRFPLAHPQVYFTLSAKACQQLRTGTYRSQPLGPQSLPSEVAALHYCTCGSRYHDRLSIREVVDRFPWFPLVSRHDIYCLDQDQPNSAILEWIRTDLGGPSHLITRKARGRLDRWMAFPSFVAAQKHNAFRFVFLTSTSEKSQALHESLSAQDWPDDASIHMAVIPQLFRFTARYRHGS